MTTGSIRFTVDSIQVYPAATLFGRHFQGDLMAWPTQG